MSNISNELPSEVIIALRQTFKDTDALDDWAEGDEGGEGGGGDIEDAINELLPDESALSAHHVDFINLRLRHTIQDLRLEEREMREELGSGKGENRMQVIQDLIGDLLLQIRLIRERATESEVIVRDITRDIRALDLAKTNLMTSMRGLKRFQMLVNAFDQLTRLAKAKKYRETAHSLQAVKQLATYFKSYTSVSRVAMLWRALQDIQGVLRAQVLNDFESGFTQETSRSGGGVNKNQSLIDACLVVDALGDETRKQLIDWYSNLQLKEYRRIFRPTDEAGQLDNISRRFAWFRRVLKTHDEEHGNIFPKEWNVGGCLVGNFSELTREDLKSVLARAAPTLNVTALLEALAITKEFETQMARKYGKTVDELSKLATTSLGIPSPISTAFESHLGIFVDAQDKTLSDMLSSFRSIKPLPPVPSMTSAATDQDSSSSNTVLPSSTELFYFYRETLEKCASLSNKTALLDLCGVYKKWLKVYAEDVLGGGLVKNERRSSSEGRPNVQDLTSACMIINTADYCCETATQLEERLREKISPELREKVTLEPEKEVFLAVIASAILVMLRELELTCDPPFGSMLKSPWKDAEVVISESAYISELRKAIVAVVEPVKGAVEQKKYLRNFCDKAVNLVITKFTQTIVKCRPITPTGAEQIILDLQGLKACLLTLPALPGESAVTSYTRYVTKSVGRIDTLLKVIMTPEAPAENFVSNYIVLIPCQSFSDFQKMLDLKGVRRTDQNNLLDVFLARTSTMPDLADSSFLTTLDMDSNPSQSLTASSISPLSQAIPVSSPIPLPTNINIFSGLVGGASLPMLPGSSASGSRTPGLGRTLSIDGGSPLLSAGIPGSGGGTGGSSTPLGSEGGKGQQLFGDFGRKFTQGVRLFGSGR